MAHDVFISYSSKDKKVADAVCSALESVKIRCWIAPRDIFVGEKWPEAISDAIEKSNIMVLIFSSNSNNSKDVSKELVLAMNAGVTVVPLRIEEVQPKGVMKYYLSDTHWIDALNPPTKKQIESIIETVSMLVYKRKTGPDDQKAYKKEDDIMSSEQGKEVPGKKVKISQSSRLLIILAAVMFAAIIATVFIVTGIYRKINESNVSASETSAGKTTKEEIAAGTQNKEPEITKDTASLEGTTIENNKISSIVGNCDTPGNANKVYIDGNYAYIADGNTGLQIIDITDKKNPSIIGSCKTPGNAQGVYVGGNYAYVVGDEGLYLIDISDKKNPDITGSSNGGYGGVYLEGNYAYVVGDKELQIFDITDKKNPSIVGNYKLFSDYIIKKNEDTEFVRDIHVEGNYAYITVFNSEMGLQIIDIADKKNPKIIGSCRTSNYICNVYANGDYAYAVGNEGLQVIDTTDKKNPRIVGNSFNGGLGGLGIYLEENYAYVASANEGFLIVDITDKKNPNFIGICDTPGNALGIYVVGNYVYIADNEEGLQIIDTGVRKD